MSLIDIQKVKWVEIKLSMKMEVRLIFFTFLKQSIFGVVKGVLV